MKYFPPLDITGWRQLTLNPPDELRQKDLQGFKLEISTHTNPLSSVVPFRGVKCPIFRPESKIYLGRLLCPESKIYLGRLLCPESKKSGVQDLSWASKSATCPSFLIQGLGISKDFNSDVQTNPCLYSILVVSPKLWAKKGFGTN